jgi:hypothetical protein
MNGGRKKPYKTHTTQKNKKMSNTTPREREREREREILFPYFDKSPAILVVSQDQSNSCR